jgi:chaperonin cofactor prefoldin
MTKKKQRRTNAELELEIDRLQIEVNRLARQLETVEDRGEEMARANAVLKMELAAYRAPANKKK